MDVAVQARYAHSQKSLRRIDEENPAASWVGNAQSNAEDFHTDATDVDEDWETVMLPQAAPGYSTIPFVGYPRVCASSRAATHQAFAAALKTMSAKMSELKQTFTAMENVTEPPAAEETTLSMTSTADEATTTLATVRSAVEREKSRCVKSASKFFLAISKSIALDDDISPFENTTEPLEHVLPPLYDQQDGPWGPGDPTRFVNNDFVTTNISARVTI